MDWIQDVKIYKISLDLCRIFKKFFIIFFHDIYIRPKSEILSIKILAIFETLHTNYKLWSLCPNLSLRLLFHRNPQKQWWGSVYFKKTERLSISPEDLIIYYFYKKKMTVLKISKTFVFFFKNVKWILN